MRYTQVLRGGPFDGQRTEQDDDLPAYRTFQRHRGNRAVCNTTYKLEWARPGDEPGDPSIALYRHLEAFQ